MQYSLEQLSNKRWGFYYGSSLLATLGCHQTACKILALLQDPNFNRFPRPVLLHKVKITKIKSTKLKTA